MAAPIACDLCGGEQAVIMQSELDTGNTVAVGPACMVIWYTSALAAFCAPAPDEVKATWLPLLDAVHQAVGFKCPPAAPGSPPAAEHRPAHPSGRGRAPKAAESLTGPPGTGVPGKAPQNDPPSF